ncbi:MAG: hypothetical protein KA314_12785 [Chloroflexi bacterium]|nr:hypothetical protein [Chloroflexota bacterium]MBP8056712.1 hypothetical protein [Chloroflexota bacterium]
MIKKHKKDPNKQFETVLNTFFNQAKAQFGPVVKGQWFYTSDTCPGCGSPVNALQYKNKDAVSLNAFIYRPRGILIGYLLCGRCAGHIFEATKKNPRTETPLHAIIEQNLTTAYLHYMASLDA